MDTRQFPCEHLVNTFTRPIHQFDRKKTAFVQLVKNNSGSEKTQKPKKQGVIANPLSSFIYPKTRSPFFKTGGFNAHPSS
jgi:hypothetical protein